MAWKKLSSKKILDHPRMKVHEDLVELPSGHRTDYVHFGEALDAAIIIVRNDRGQILLQREYSYPPDSDLFQFPGGGLKKDEPPIKGAERELAEETQLGGKLRQIGWFYFDSRRSKSKMYVFVATDLHTSTGQRDFEEEFETFWFAPNKINQLIRSNEICSAPTLAAWAFFRQ